MKKVWVKIKKERVEKGFSQEYMAHQLNISQRSYSQLENGHTRMTVGRLNTIAKILEVEITDLVE